MNTASNTTRVNSVVSPIQLSTLASLILVSSFGPYIVSSFGLRLEQLLIYSVFFLLLITGKIKVPRNAALISLLLCFFLLLLVPILTLHEENFIRSSLVVAQLENNLQMPVVFLIFVLILRTTSPEGCDKLFTRFTSLVIGMLVANTFFSFYLIWNPTSELIRLFSGSRVDMNLAGMTPAEASIRSGRITGVFSQVYEAGYAYALGLFFWVYGSYSKRSMSLKDRLKDYFMLLMLLIGGALSFSKIFLVLGIPIFLFFFGLKRFFRFGLSITFLFLLVFALNNNVLTIISELRGLWGLFRLFDLSVLDFVAVYTSGRFSEDSTIMSSILNVLQVSPLLGFGYGSIETSDFALNEVISQGGLIGLFIYLALHFLLASLALQFEKGPGRNLYLGFLAITFIGALAAPIISANRISVFIWMTVAWAVCRKLPLAKNFKALNQASKPYG